MTDQNDAPAGAAASAFASTQDIEDRLASFDFDETPQSEPAGNEPAKHEAGDDIDAEAAAAAASEAPTAQADDEDDREVNLRDNTKVKIRELKRAYRPNWETEVREFTEKQKAFQEKTQGFTQQEQAIAQILQNAIAFAEAELPKPPSDELRKQDIFAWTEAKAEYDARMGKLNELKANQAQMLQQAEARKQQEFREHVTRENQALLTKRPELRDPVKMTKFWEDTKTLAANLGFSPQEVGQISDHRVLLLINAALEGQQLKAAYERAKAKAAEAKKQNESKPVVQSPQPRLSTAQREANGMRERLARLRKTGSVADAEAFLSSFD